MRALTRAAIALAIGALILLPACTPSDAYSLATMGLILAGGTPSPAYGSSGGGNSCLLGSSASCVGTFGNRSNEGSSNGGANSGSSAQGENASHCISLTVISSTALVPTHIHNHCGYKVNWRGFSASGSDHAGTVSAYGEDRAAVVFARFYACKYPSTAFGPNNSCR